MRAPTRGPRGRRPPERRRRESERVRRRRVRTPLARSYSCCLHTGLRSRVPSCGAALALAACPPRSWRSWVASTGVPSVPSFSWRSRYRSAVIWTRCFVLHASRGAAARATRRPHRAPRRTTARRCTPRPSSRGGSRRRDERQRLLPLLPEDTDLVEALTLLRRSGHDSRTRASAGGCPSTDARSGAGNDPRRSSSRAAHRSAKSSEASRAPSSAGDHEYHAHNALTRHPAREDELALRGARR